MPSKQKTREEEVVVELEIAAVKEAKKTTINVDVSVLGVDGGTQSFELEEGTDLGQLIATTPTLQGQVEIVVNNERVTKAYKLKEGDLVVGVTDHIVGG